MKITKKKKRDKNGENSQRKILTTNVYIQVCDEVFSAD